MKTLKMVFLSPWTVIWDFFVSVNRDSTPSLQPSQLWVWLFTSLWLFSAWVQKKHNKEAENEGSVYVDDDDVEDDDTLSYFKSSLTRSPF